MDFSMVPDGVAGWIAPLIIATSFFTAALTAAMGLGGGLALLAVMSVVMPAAAVVPLHGVSQMGSNGGRAIVQARWTRWPIVGWFALGAVVGAAIGGRVAVSLPAPVLQGAIAVFILYSQWGPMPKARRPVAWVYALVGVVATFLTMFLGATGPVVATMLSAEKLDRFGYAATHGTCMVLQHGLKAVAFGLFGFAFAAWAGMIIGVLIFGFLGTLAGTYVLKRLPEADFRRAFRWVLTVIAVYLLIQALVGLRTG